MTTPTPPLASFARPFDGPPTVTSCAYDAGTQTLFIIARDGKLYTYSSVPADVANHLQNGPAIGMFSNLTATKWPHTVGPAPTE